MLKDKGLNKLMEECGELVQVSAKKAVCDEMGTDTHWDSPNSISKRLEDEIADVMAIIQVVILLHNLNDERIAERMLKKHDLFMKWEEQ